MELFIGTKSAFLAKLIPRQDPELSLKKWIAIAKNDKSLPGNIQNLAKKAEKDRKDSEKEILKSHFINYIYAKAPKDLVILKRSISGIGETRLKNWTLKLNQQPMP